MNLRAIKFTFAIDFIVPSASLQEISCLELLELGFIPTFGEEVKLTLKNGTTLICSLEQLYNMSEPCSSGNIGINHICYKLDFLEQNAYQAEE